MNILHITVVSCIDSNVFFTHADLKNDFNKQVFNIDNYNLMQFTYALELIVINQLYLSSFTYN